MNWVCFFLGMVERAAWYIKEAMSKASNSVRGYLVAHAKLISPLSKTPLYLICGHYSPQMSAGTQLILCWDKKAALCKLGHYNLLLLL